MIDTSIERKSLTKIIESLVVLIDETREGSTTRVDIRRDERGTIVVESDGPLLGLDQSFEGREFIDSTDGPLFGSSCRSLEAPRWCRHLLSLSLLAQSYRTLEIEEAQSKSTSSFSFVDGSFVNTTHHGGSSLQHGVRSLFEPDPILRSETPFNIATARAAFEGYAVLHRGLEYMTAGWLQWVAQNPTAELLPPLIPVVLTHTERGWSSSARFHDLFEPSEVFELVKGHVPDFRFVLDDLALQDDGQIRTRIHDEFTALSLLLLRDARLGIDMVAWLKHVVPDLLVRVVKSARARELLAAVMRYILTVARHNTATEIGEAFGEILDTEAKTMTMTIAEQLIQQGELKGTRHGLAPLLRLFGRKLGRVLTQAEQDELVARLERLSADRLGDVVLDLDAVQLEAWLADPNAI